MEDNIKVLSLLYVDESIVMIQLYLALLLELLKFYGMFQDSSLMGGRRKNAKFRE